MGQGGPALKADRESKVGLSAYTAEFRHAAIALPERYGSLEVPLTITIPHVAKASEVSSVQEFLMRALDVVLSMGILALAWPVMGILAILIKLTSPGKVIYRQKRVGKDGKIFTLYKFRSMVPDAEKHTGPVLASPDDGRVTPIGRFMRRTRLDELPQLFNVIKGDMSLVGPRPERPYFVSRHKALQGIRLSVRPGITGLAQIRGAYDLRPEHKLRYDYIYIRNRSVLLNLGILVRTIPVVIRQLGR